MSKTPSMTLAAFTALALFSGLSQAGGRTYIAAEDGNYRPLTCEEASQAAWFHRQLELTDGDTSPEVPAVPECRSELIASIEEWK